MGKQRILVIEDYELILEYYLNILGKDFEVLGFDGEKKFIGASSEKYGAMRNPGEHPSQLFNKVMASFRPHLVTIDIQLPRKDFSGLDILKMLQNNDDVVKIIITGDGDSKLAAETMAFSFYRRLYKGDMLPLIEIINEGLEQLGERKKHKWLERFQQLGKFKRLVKDERNIDDNDRHSEGPGSQGFGLAFEAPFGHVEMVKVLGLYLPKSDIKYAACIPTSWGCRMNCPFCRSGTEEVYRGEYSVKNILAMQAYILEHCYYFNRDKHWFYFELDDASDSQPVFEMALMGMGDLANNFHSIIRVAEIVNSVFYGRCQVAVSTLISKGVEKLIAYKEKGGIATPVLQISLHGKSKRVRKIYVDSGEDPEKLCVQARQWSNLTGYKVRANWILSEETTTKSELSGLFAMVDGDHFTISFSDLTSSKEGMNPASKKSKERAYWMAQIHNVQCEMGPMLAKRTGGGCGQFKNEPHHLVV